MLILQTAPNREVERNLFPQVKYDFCSLVHILGEEDAEKHISDLVPFYQILNFPRRMIALFVLAASRDF